MCPPKLFHQIGYEGQECQVACTFHCLSDAALVFEGSAGDATGQDFALFVEELFEEFGIFVVNILDSALFEAAVFFLFGIYGGGSEIADFRL